jgi:TrmH family RNA methyltransferase
MTDYPNLTPVQNKSIQKLLVKKYREREEKFLIEGPHLVEEALKSSWKVEEILVTSSFISNPHARNILKTAEINKTKILKVSESVISKVSDTVTSQGIVAVVIESRLRLQDLWRQRSRDALVVALDGITDPGNVGTIIRSCDWFGVDAVLLGQGTVELYNPKTLRSTMGSIFHIPIFTDVDLDAEIPAARKYGYTLLAATSGGGTPVDKNRVSQKSLVVFGNEARGIRGSLLEMVDDQITIPRFGKAESLNVGTSVGIILGWFRI